MLATAYQAHHFEISAFNEWNKGPTAINQLNFQKTAFY